MSLADVGEDAVIERLVGPGDPLAAGPGDDCAVVDGGGEELWLLKTDAVVAGVHYEEEAPAEQVGWKAAARVMSDFAAMGGRPERLLVTVALPVETRVEWLEGVYRGIRRCLRQCGGALVGGETTRVPPGSAAVLVVAGQGRVGRDAVVTRSGARPGDLLAVTGRLGGSLGGRHLSFQPRLAEGAWLARHGATAMMDVSDGLARDLPRMMRASGCPARVDRDRLPCHDACDIEAALHDGEDYELLVALDPRRFRAAEWPAGLAPLTVIGEFGEEAELEEGGWDAFRS